MVVKKVLILGFYHHRNLGDELFKEAFKKLFPDYELTFTNHITVPQATNCDAIFIGGGSFLDQPLAADPEAVWEIAYKPLLYIGVGLETDIHHEHMNLLNRACLIAARSDVGLGKVPNAIVIPDLVHSLNQRIPSPSTRQGILFIPNVSVIPLHSEPQWKHAAWNYFKSECTQFLDELVSKRSRVQIMPICRDSKNDDMWAASELLAGMETRCQTHVYDYMPKTAKEAVQYFSQFEFVITQRFHGGILADMASTPCVSIAHHDKLLGPNSIPYYGLTKSALKNAILAEHKPRSRELDEGLFENLINRVNQLL